MKAVQRSLQFFLCLLVGSIALGSNAVAQDTSQSEPVSVEEYYRIVTLPIPEGITLEASGLALLPGGALAVSTRHGEVWIVENPTMAGGAPPYYERFAYGLHEPLGLAYHDGALYTVQRSELTRLEDTDGDGHADRYERIQSWPLSGNYHEYAYGPQFLPDGSMIVSLNVGWIGHGASLVPWRGWIVKITPEGEMIPLAAGMRSPAGMGLNAEGDLFYSENQGDWIGSGRITHVEKGDFLGHPASLKWTDLPEAPDALEGLTPSDVSDSGKPMHVVKKEIPQLKLPTVWFPHTILGISTSDILVDSTGGAFGPFEGQLFVGDQGHSEINRVFLEKVEGEYQGAVFPFMKGFASGILRLAWGGDGSLFVGMTERGWNATGPEPYGLQRVVWTGKMPFEMLEMRAERDGFTLEFTKPVDPQTAREAAAYALTGFTYKYHSTYGSPVVQMQNYPVRRVEISEDGRTVHLFADGLREGYIYQLKVNGLRAADGTPLLHGTAYYTLTNIPGGGQPVAEAESTEASAASSTMPEPLVEEESVAPAVQALPKHQTERPEAWVGGSDRVITIGTEPGLRFDRTEFAVEAGSRVKLVFVNDDDMLHNVVIARPGTWQAVAQAAIALGLQGPAQDYVPATEDVLYHTSLLEPETRQVIYFRAPEEPGDYPYLCSFPGHARTMQGTMHVVAP